MRHGRIVGSRTDIALFVRTCSPPASRDVPTPENPPISRRRGAPPPRIVVADDNIDVREVIALVLRTRGFDVVVASDGDAVLAAILSDGADALVSNSEMPGLTLSGCVVCCEVCAPTQLCRS
jgi:hypothetical protein